jgi:hypothetical protein
VPRLEGGDVRLPWGGRRTEPPLHHQDIAYLALIYTLDVHPGTTSTFVPGSRLRLTDVLWTKTS